MTVLRKCDVSVTMGLPETPRETSPVRDASSCSLVRARESKARTNERISFFTQIFCGRKEGMEGGRKKVLEIFSRNIACFPPCIHS